MRLLFTLLLAIALTFNIKAQPCSPTPQFTFANSITDASFSGYPYLDWDVQNNLIVTSSFEGTVDLDHGPGTANFTSLGGRDIFIAKYDTIGNLIWAKSFGGSDNDVSAVVKTDASGNIYVGGLFTSTDMDFDAGPGVESASAASNDGFLVKYDLNGNHIWSFNLQSTSADEVHGITIDPSGNVIISGNFLNTMDINPGPATTNISSNGNRDIFIAKY